ncbi:pyrroline-5-carboxylate reductase [Methanoplanus sp. FWC-SCC4]|uniref:Pyrroline-5-carboxylate reductase n=1 Tax=Methanochimaera problematica TaxID=2609417 RepID=A0AA97FC57_9EURY|nr:pyrroline-5-carboxylate reductase [Methanoplanus sp. FWC-SCC4]WOF16765.1 pyrroline-5-carboxylate reductase [Methanoplanus sp. FWC-SCC4]
MKKTGVIGTGSMGGMLVRKFIESEISKPEMIIAGNRTEEKLRLLAKETGINAAKNNIEVVENSDVIFLCVKPLEVKGVLAEIKEVLNEDKILVSVAADVSLENLSEWSNARIVRAIPSITSEVLKGVTLLSFGERAAPADKELILSMFGAIGKAVEAEEKDFEILTILTSCAPAFIASILKELSKSAVRREGISKELSEFLVRETLVGTSCLLEEKNQSFEDIISRVATKGGITEEGVFVIQKEMPAVFDNLLDAALGKDIKVNKMIN